MRPIKFRGKAKDDIYTDCGDLLYEKGQWVYGNLIVSGNRRWIVGGVADVHHEGIGFEFWCPVDPDTVGQFTGMQDKNDVKIWEGDILSTQIGGDQEQRDTVIFDDGYVWSYVDLYWALNLLRARKVGNFHDSPELLEVKK